MSTVHVRSSWTVARISPAIVSIENCRPFAQPVAVQVHERLARAVARQLGLAAVRVEDPQRATKPGSRSG
jgi:LDH2 family malate/lactate/ureidoglycolate dehydrogenase